MNVPNLPINANRKLSVYGNSCSPILFNQLSDTERDSWNCSKYIFIHWSLSGVEHRYKNNMSLYCSIWDTAAFVSAEGADTIKWKIHCVNTSYGCSYCFGVRKRWGKGRGKGDKKGGTINFQMDVIKNHKKKCKILIFNREDLKYFWNTIYGRMFTGKW